MTDSHRGMEGSENRIHTLRKAAPALLLVGIVAVAGCGGGGGSKNSAKPLAPVTKSKSSGVGTVVSAGGTLGLVGPAGRATSKTKQFEDKAGKIPANSNHKPKHANGVAGEIQCDNSDLMPSDTNQAQINAAILCLVNGERADNNLPALTENSQLDQAAAGMAALMVKEQFFSHETPEGKTVVDRVQPTGYIPDSGDWVVGENLAWGDGSLSTPQAIVNGWMNSPGHKANILAPDYKDIGLAAAQGSPTTQATGGTTYVNDFGAKTGADLNAKLPSEDGSTSASTSDTSSSSGNQATVASKSPASGKKKAKHHRKRKHHKKH
jgi:uncharacterized protein YkwD